MRIKWILATLSALILLPVLLLVAILVFLDTADLSRHRDLIAAQVSELAGRRVSLQGELDLNLGRTTSVVISDIALANASWASEPEMLSIERVEAQIELAPLLRGEIRIPRFHVQGVRARVETDQDGVGNWVMARPQVDGDAPAADRGPGDLSLPWLGDVQLSGIEVIYLDGQTGQRVSTVLDHVRLGADTPQTPTEFDVKGRVNDEPVEINGKVAIPARLATDRMEFPLELQARVLDIKSEASGRITGELESPAITLDVDVNAADLNQLRQVFGDAVPLAENVSLAMEVAGEQGQPVTMKLHAAASEARLDSRLTVHRDGPRPRLVASIDLASLDVVQMWASYFSGQPAQAKAAVPDAAQPAQPNQLDRPIALDWLAAFDADITIAANDINLPEVRISHFQSRIMIDDRRLTVEHTKLDTDAGSVTAQFSLDDRGKQPAINFALDTTDVALDSIEALAENERARSSSASAAVSLATQGDTVVSLVDGMTGHIELKYSNKKLRDKLALKMMREAASKSDRPPLRVSASGAVDGHAVRLDGKVIYPAQVLLSKKPYNIDLDVQALGVKGDINGTVPYTLDGADLDIIARADSLAEFRKAFGEAVPAVGKTKLQTHLNLQQARLKLSKLMLNLGGGSVEGWAAVDASGSKPNLQADLSLADLDFDTLLAPGNAGTAAKPAEKPAGNRVFSDEPLPFDVLSRANAQATLRASNLVISNRQLKQAEININLAGGRLSASLLKLASAQGDILGDVLVDASGTADPSVMVKLRAARIDLSQLLATVDGTPPIEGPLATDIHLQGRGNSIAQIMGSLDGKVHLLIEEGRADAKALDLFVGGLSAMFGTIFSADASRTRINCAICDLKFNQGLMTSELAVLDTQYSTVFLDGQVNLKNEQLDLKVSPEAKGVTLSVAFPVLVKGTMAAPNIDVEKKGALIKTGQLWATVAYPPAALVKFDDLVGEGKHNPCVSMVAKKAGIPFVEEIGKAVKGTVKATGKVVEGTVEGTGKVVGGTVEGTGKVVKGVGGVLKDAGSGLGKIFDRKKDDADAGTDTQEEEDDDFDMDF